MPQLSPRDLLIRLGSGSSIANVCAKAGMSRGQFDDWWRAECRRRVPSGGGSRRVSGLAAGVRIERDRWGIPHVFARSDADLFFGFGYATAQDRLFQLDFLRRRARGRLAEILGTGAVESDQLYRTIGLAQIAAAEWATLPDETRTLLEAYTAGINAQIEACRDVPPIECDLLDYRPEPWQPSDSLAIIGEFRWYLTGRFPVIAIPELAKRALGEGPLFQAFLQGEADEESILHPGEYPAAPGGVESLSGGGQDQGGSNNWVLAGTRTTTGKPLVANDPHIPFWAVSIWQEVRLSGGTFQVAGAALAGMPAVMIGRTPQVAWGITNNICSLRDLYQEKTEPGHPGCFLFDGQWEPAQERVETIRVKGAAPARLIVLSSRNGPIVDEILPAPARKTGPVSLRWLGTQRCGWLTALLGMNRASSGAEFRAATRPWLVPTFNLVFADVHGNIGFQTVGRIPLRQVPERGYRPGWDPKHQWTGLIPFEGLPRLANPPRGFIVTANNRVAPSDFPYPLAGTSSNGHRALRIRTLLEQGPLGMGPARQAGPTGQAGLTWSADQTKVMQQDIFCGRGDLAVPGLVKLLGQDPEPRLRAAVALLAKWDRRCDVDSVGAALFNVFFVHWCKGVAAARFPKDEVDFVSGHVGGLAAALLHGDTADWFPKGQREQAVRAAFVATLD